MSSIGRILIVVNLLLAALFAGWAAQALQEGQSYKDKYEELQQTSADELRVANDENADLIAQLREREGALAGARDTAQDKTTEAERLQTELNAARADNQALKASLDGMDSRLADLARNVDSTSERAEKAASDARDAIVAKEDAEDAQREAERAQRDAEDEARRLGTQVASLEGRVATLTGDLDSANNRLDAVVALTGVDPNDILDVPPLDRDVIAVRMDLAPGFVSINAVFAAGVD
ncbi:MAG: hypothetical protein AAFZ65_11575, partial [Planctomycetota bacterium]